MNWSLISRIVAAAGGGYVFTSLVVADLALLMRAGGTANADAVLGSTLMSFAVYAAAVMAVFHARSALRAWVWLGGASVPLAAVLFMLRAVE